jgi:hypothetical protein
VGSFWIALASFWRDSGLLWLRCGIDLALFLCCMDVSWSLFWCYFGVGLASFQGDFEVVLTLFRGCFGVAPYVWLGLVSELLSLSL